MKKLIYFLTIALALTSCENDIKDTESIVEVEQGTEVVDSSPLPELKGEVPEPIEYVQQEDTVGGLIGYWVGYFERNDDGGWEKAIAADEGFVWNRQNKINISIDWINDTVVQGHSVVAGNDRPFTGTVKHYSNDSYYGIGYLFNVVEPGDDKFDGEFTFEIVNTEKNGYQLIGTWEAYGDIDIKQRKYTLEKRSFLYDPNQLLEHVSRYIEWENFTETKIEESGDYEEGDEYYTWIEKEFATATEKIYEVNASNTLLIKEDVDNLKKGDLTIIRNTIYARHGYCFKNRPLRVFFDAQPWYIPVHTNIRDEFTEIEKANIKLLLSYEENASEYYDYFGRG